MGKIGTMKYFSTFSGIGGFEMAMPSDWECAGYSEIDKFAIQCYQSHFPNHKNYGDITRIDIPNLPDFDLLVGGSPCHDLSVAKKNRKGLEGDRSKLFFKWLEILKIKKPKYFILENVNSMSKENKASITKYISEVRGDMRDYSPIMVDAALVSAQSRKRLFWCNFPVSQPEDRKIFLKDILEPEVDEKYFIRNKTVLDKLTYMKGKKKKENGFQEGSIRFPQTESEKAFPILTGENSISRTSNFVAQAQIGFIGENNMQGYRVYSEEGKSQPLASSSGGIGGSGKSGLYIMPEKSYPLDANYHKGTDVESYFQRHKRQIVSGCAYRTRAYAKQEGKIETREDGKANSLTSLSKDSMVESFGIRKLTPVECERLQSFPDNFTSILSNSQRYKCLGNAVNVDVVKHIIGELIKCQKQ